MPKTLTYARPVTKFEFLKILILAIHAPFSRQVVAGAYKRQHQWKPLYHILDRRPYSAFRVLPLSSIKREQNRTLWDSVGFEHIEKYGNGRDEEPN